VSTVKATTSKSRVHRPGQPQQVTVTFDFEANDWSGFDDEREVIALDKIKAAMKMGEKYLITPTNGQGDIRYHQKDELEITTKGRFTILEWEHPTQSPTILVHYLKDYFTKVIFRAEEDLEFEATLSKNTFMMGQLIPLPDSPPWLLHGSLPD